MSVRREDGSPANAAPSLVLLERLVALADRAIDAARGGDMMAVNALLDEREPFLAQLAGALSRRPDPSPARAPDSPAPDAPPADPVAPADARLAGLARRDAEAMMLLERRVAEARVDMAHELDALTAVQAAVSGYAGDGPRPPSPGSIDVRR